MHPHDETPRPTPPTEPTEDCTDSIIVTGRYDVDLHHRGDGDPPITGMIHEIRIDGRESSTESTVGHAPYQEIKSDVDIDATVDWLTDQGPITEHSREIGTVRYDVAADEYTWEIRDEFRADADARLVTDGGTSTQCTKCGDTSTDDNNVEITYDSDSGSMRCRACQIGDRLGSPGDVQLPPGSHL